MANSPTSKSEPRRRSQLARSWSELWPVAAAITVFGMAAVMQVGACARVTVIQSELQGLQKQEKEYEGDIQALRSELAGLQDVSMLRGHMISSGFTKESDVTSVTVEGLPDELLEVLPGIEPAIPAPGGEPSVVIASRVQ